MANARYIFAAVLFNNTIYVFGGNDADAESSVEAFDPHTQTWTMKAQPPSGAQKKSHAAVVFRDLIWLCGGWMGSSITNTCFTYNPLTDVWSSVASMTTDRDYFELIVLGDSIYAIGGLVSPKTVERYDASTNVWVMLPDELLNDALSAVIVPVEQ